MWATRAILAGAAAVLAAAGCGGMTAGSGPGGAYRTVRADPGRNTEAAAKRNQEGLRHLEEGDLEAARKAFERALTDDVKFGPAHNNLGKVFFKQQNWYKAAWEFQYAADLLPTFPQPRNNLGLVLEEAGRLNEAVEAYRAAVALDPKTVAYRANLARALVKRGDRTPELREMLVAVVARETRPAWHDWARLELARLGPRPGGALERGAALEAE